MMELLDYLDASLDELLLQYFLDLSILNLHILNNVNVINVLVNNNGLVLNMTANEKIALKKYITKYYELKIELLESKLDKLQPF